MRVRDTLLGKNDCGGGERWEESRWCLVYKDRIKTIMEEREKCRKLLIRKLDDDEEEEEKKIEKKQKSRI